MKLLGSVTLLAGLGLIVWALLALAGYAHAHDAPAGWSYAPECCGGNDCRQITDDAVEVTAQGYKIRETGEIFLQNQTRQSKDGHYHRCSASVLDTSITFCLYVPPRGT